MGNVTVVVGLQWGDEGKGRVSHFVSNDAICVRSTGGNNAGHTVVANEKKFALHLLPASIIKPNNVSIIAPGVVIDLKVLSDEIDMLQAAGIKITPQNLIISPRSHIIMPYHISMDKLHEELKGSHKIGTTLRGIGPCYSDKVNRIGIRMDDLVHCNSSQLLEKVVASSRASSLMESAMASESITYDFPALVNDYLLKYKKKLAKYIRDEREVLLPALEKDKKIVVEGAQALYLDLDQGDYPFVTSSNPSTSGTIAAAGIGPKHVKNVYGIMKAYCSRVGEGPFNTEQKGTVGHLIRELGHEYGTTTGRPRRCGWLDLVRLKNAILINGVTALCLNHLDTIGKVGSLYGKIRVCTSYVYKSHGYKKEITYVPVDGENCTPVYQDFIDGWDTSGCTTYDALPSNAKDFIQFIEEYTGVPVKYIGVGPDEKDTIVR